MVFSHAMGTIVSAKKRRHGGSGSLTKTGNFVANVEFDLDDFGLGDNGAGKSSVKVVFCGALKQHQNSSEEETPKNEMGS